MATRQSLIEVLKKAVGVLHISCHGLKLENSKPRFSLLSLEDPDDAGLDSSYLIFETQDCDTDNISGQELKELLEG